MFIFSSLKMSYLMGYMLIGFLAMNLLTSCSGGLTGRLDPGEGSGHKGGSDHKEFCLKATLSEEQKTTIRELRGNSRESTQDLSREERRAQREQLRQNILALAETDKQKTALSECLSRQDKHRNRPPK